MNKLFFYLNWKNRYPIVLFLFAFWMLFLCDYDIFFLVKSYKKSRALNCEYLVLTKLIEDYEQELKQLQSKEYIERYARERYFFKKKNEIIFFDSLHE